VVTFQNTTAKNCVPQENTSQRYEYWNFGNHWGTGDSIVNWQPFDPPARPGYTIAFPGKVTYTIMMADSNLCGRDTAFQVIVIGDPPVADFNLSDDTVCAGEQFQAINHSSGGANAFVWNFGDGTGWQVTGGATQNKTYNIPGTYTIKNLKFGYSYDVIISSLTPSISGGAHEIALVWEWSHPKNKRKRRRPSQMFIPCPSF